MLVKISYFRPSGKWYTEAEYVTDSELMHHIYDECATLWKANRLPGVVHSSEYHVLINVPEHVYNVPHLLVTSYQG